MSLINPRHLLGAARHSLAGLRRAWDNEQAFRHEVLMLPVIGTLLFVCDPGAIWCAAALLGWFLVMALELLNSAIEEAFDLVSPTYNVHVKHGKDMASAAIFLALAGNGILWIFLVCGIV